MHLDGLWEKPVLRYAPLIVILIGMALLLRQAMPTAVAIRGEASPSDEALRLCQELGLKENWQLYVPSRRNLIANWAPSSVKIIFEAPDIGGGLHYLVDIKRAKGRKDQRLEFPGGRVDQGEDVMTALLRELKEEDRSGTLTARLRALLAAPLPDLTYKNISLEDGEHHTLFKAKLSHDTWLQLQGSGQGEGLLNREIYGFALVPLRRLDSRDAFERKQWTPKSRKILKALRASPPKPLTGSRAL